MKKFALNKRRLSKPEVQKLIEDGAELHEGYTKGFLERYPSGIEVKNLIYKLPDNNFLFVAGANSLTSPNKGDLYTEAHLIRWMRSKQRLENDSELQITNAVSKWNYYSKNGNQLIESADLLVMSLSQKLNIDIQKLDKSYQSLSLIDFELNKWSLDSILENLYDELVVYIGEVIIKRVNGIWGINQDFSGANYPYVSIGLKGVQYMPLNAVFSSLNEMEAINLRLETANEIRSQAGRVSFEKGKGERLFPSE
jgi:hypothetical protein